MITNFLIILLFILVVLDALYDLGKSVEKRKK